MKKTTAIFFIILGITVSLLRGNGSVYFNHISLDDGLSQNSVFCMLQDSKGFMWFGTQDGLNKYDGYRFTVYKPEPGNPNSLGSSRVNAIVEDRSGLFWIATDDGLNRFDPQKETFYRYRTDAEDPDCIPNEFIGPLCLDRNGALWIGTGGGGFSRLTRDAQGRETFTHYGARPGTPNQLGSRFVTAIVEDRSGMLWIGTPDDGLKKFDPGKGTFQHFRHYAGNPQSLSDRTVSAIYEDRSGTIWIGTAAAGLNVLDRIRGTFKHYRAKADDPGSLGDDSVFCIFEDRSGVLWVGTAQGGLNRFDKRTESFTRFMKDPKNPYSLNSNTITSIYEDRSRILWVGTVGGGLNKFDRTYKFEHYKSDPNNPNSLSDNFVYSVYEDRSGILWFGTSDNGLDRFDRESHTFTNYRPIPGDPRSLNNNRVRAILEDRSGTLWFGTWGGGLNKFNRETQTFTHYTRRSPHGLSSDTVLSIHEDRSGVLWIGTLGGGLNKFSRETESFNYYRHIPDNPNSLSDDALSVIYESTSEPGILWLGTRRGGVNRFDPAKETFQRFRHDPGTPSGLTTDDILSILEDGSGTLWVGTMGGGLNKLARKTGGEWECVHYTEKNGLTNNTVYGILEDPAGRLWMSTNRGISRFDPKTETFRNYLAGDGLQGSEFNGGAYFKSKSGEMFFGGINGVNAFYPARIQENPHVPPVVITGFTLFNKPLPGGYDSPGAPLRAAVPWAKEVRLSYKQNAFSFEFAALDYTSPRSNRYAYKMEGFDDHWVHTASDRRFASYTNLGPGSYVFRVKGSNNDGKWNEQGTSIKVIITPPFWGTWWFRVFLLLSVVGLTVSWYRRRLRNVRLKTELQTARDAQLAIMPGEDPEAKGFDISGICVPANEVGGDFFDYIWLNEEKSLLGIAVGDVSGKAMKSAMTAVMTSGMIYAKADEYQSVKEIMARVNRPLYFKTGKKVFTALCLASLDIPGSEIAFSNAGLNEPLMKSGDSVSMLKGVGNKLPLGIKIDSVYMEKKQPLSPGDMVVFFTDGITEAQNPRGEFYGVETLQRFLEKTNTRELTARAVKDRIIADVNRFAEGAPQHDDMTVVVVKVRGVPK